MITKNTLITALHELAMDEIRETLIKLQDETLEVGEIPRRYEDHHDDYGDVLWWNTRFTEGVIQESPEFIGQPLDGPWPFNPEDEPHLLWVPLPKLARAKP